MMQLHSLPKIKGSTHRRKIVGRGRSTGHGKTSTKGHKGQSSRTGFRQRPGFESGHIPLYRRLPRRGFNNARFKAVFAEVNVGDLNAFKAGTTVDAKALSEAGIIRNADDVVKLLANGELKAALTVVVDAASASAKAKVEKAGGKVEVLAPKVEAPAKAEKAEKKPAKK